MKPDITLLYVEDDIDTRERIWKELGVTYSEMKIYVAGNGTEGLEKYREHQPDIIVTDINMPVMDGVQMAKAIKKLNEEVIIIAVTAFSDTEYLLRAIDAGISHYILKPVSYDNLFAAINKSIDLVTLKRRIREQHEHIRKLSKAVESSPVSVIITDSRGTIEYVNPKFVEVTGYTKEESIGQNPRMLESGEIPPDVYKDLWSTINAGGQWQGELLNRKKNGKFYWEAVSISPLFDEDGNISHFVAVQEDITQRKRAEEALRESEGRFRGIFENAAVGISLFDVDGRLLRANGTLREILGFSEEELRGRFFDSFTHPEDQEPDRSRYISLMRGESESYNVEKRYARKDGSYVWVRVARSAQVGEGGRPAYCVTVVEDIGERKDAEKKLQQSTALLCAVTENTPDFIFVKDCLGRMLMANPATLQDLGKAPEEVIGKTDAEFLGGEAGERIMENDRMVIAGGKTLVVEEIPHPDGDRHVYLSTKSPYLDAQSNVIGLIGISRDITDRKLAEEERERLLAELQRSNEDLQQFAYVASHDLQEPLRMVSNYIQLLERKYKEQLDEKAKEYIYYAVDGTTRMQKLIEGLLSYSRITREIELSPVDTNATCAAAVANLEQALRETEGEVIVDQLPTVLGNEAQLVQLFQNLIGNGLKYCNHGDHPRIHVSAQQQGMEWTFSISDNGIGIDPEHYDRIFQIFQRLHTNEEFPGTGIGLASCKRIVERHGGRIWVESTPGEGSTFYFTLSAPS